MPGIAAGSQPHQSPRLDAELRIGFHVDVLHHAVGDVRAGRDEMAYQRSHVLSANHDAVLHPHVAQHEMARLADDDGTVARRRGVLAFAVAEGDVLNKAATIVCDEGGAVGAVHGETRNGVALSVEMGDKGFLLAHSHAVAPRHSCHVDVVGKHHVTDIRHGVAQVGAVAQQRKVGGIVDIVRSLSEPHVGEELPSVGLRIVFLVGHEELLVVAVHQIVARDRTEHVEALPLGRLVGKACHCLQGIVAAGEGAGADGL